MEILNFYKTQNIKKIYDRNEYIELLNFFPNKIPLKYLDRFKYDDKIRISVFKIILVVMVYFGFIIKNDYRVIILDKYEENIDEIPTIINFLNIINMKFLSILFFLGLCQSEHFDISKIRDFWLETMCFDLKGLNYNNNSCYQDSVLICLLGIPNNIINEQILYKDLSSIKKKIVICDQNEYIDYQNRLEIQKELNNITLYMRSGVNEETYECTNLRNLLKRCPGSQNFHLGREQDAGEFLQYILGIFQVEIMRIKRVTIVANEQKYFQTSENISLTLPILTISIFQLSNDTYDLTASLHIEEDSYLDVNNRYKDADGNLYNRRLEIMDVLDTPYLVFYAQRLNYDNRRNKTRIIFPPEIRIGNRFLYLSSIVIHQNNHYTCYITKCNKWYYYNDMNEDLKKIESLKYANPDPEVLGTLYFYN